MSRVIEFTAPAALEEFADDLEPLVQALMKMGSRKEAGLIQFCQGAARDKAHGLRPPQPIKGIAQDDR